MTVLGTNPTQEITVISTPDWTAVRPFPADIPANPINRDCYNAKQRLLERQIRNGVKHEVQLEAKGQWCAVTQDLEGLHRRGSSVVEFKVVLMKDSRRIDEELVTRFSE